MDSALALYSPASNLSADFDAFLLPVMRGVQGMFLLGGTLAQSCKNLIPDKPNATVIGAPTVSANSIGCQGLVNCLQTSILQTAEMTIYVVGKSADTFVDNAHRPMFVSNYLGTRVGDATKNSNGVYVGVTGSAGAPQATLQGVHSVINPDGTSAAIGAQISVADMSTYKLMTSRKIATSREIRNETNNQSQIVPSALPDDLGTRALRIGSGYSAFGGLCDLALVIIATVGHTDDERSAINATSRSLMTLRAIGAV